MPRVHGLTIGLAGYVLAVAPMVYFVGFVGAFVVPKHVDSGVAGPAGAALAVNLLLVASFAAVHSFLARQGIQGRLAAALPGGTVRSVYSAVAGLQMITLMALWRPLPEPAWRLAGEIERATAWGLFALGWAMVLWALASIDSAHLFGLRQALAVVRGRPEPAAELRARGPYRLLRHPLYAGTVVALFATPEMSRGHLLLATSLTAYIAVGMRFEERRLARQHGDAYRRYRRDVPGLLARCGRFFAGRARV